MIRLNGASGGLILKRSGGKPQRGRAQPTEAGVEQDPARAKRDLRAQLAGRVGALSAAQRERSSSEICDRVASLDAFETAEQLLIYHALPDEVSLARLVQIAAERGKELYLPRTAAGARFVRWLPGGPLVVGRFGVAEPAVPENGAEPPGPDDRETLVVVPGRGYDRRGHRLGRGAGWYDRALAGLGAGTPTVGVAYACQVVDEVPVAEHDRRVDHLVTEDFVVDCREA